MSEDKDLTVWKKLEPEDPLCVTLRELRRTVDACLNNQLYVAMRPEEKTRFAQEHPGADMVIGNFEIRKIKR